MIALVFLAAVINFLDRQTLSAAASSCAMSNVTYSRVVPVALGAINRRRVFTGACVYALPFGTGRCLNPGNVVATSRRSSFPRTRPLAAPGERELARHRLTAALELRERLGHGRVEETRRALIQL